MRWVWIALGLVGCKVHFDDLASHDAGTTERPCPDHYVFVAGNAALGTGDFCVMQFEAKVADAADQIIFDGCDAPTCTPQWDTTNVHAVSAPQGLPFREVTALVAQTKCQEIGAGYDLLANREWMTIARQAEANPLNWDSGAPGAGQLAQGNTNGAMPYGIAPVGDTDDPYSDTGETAQTLWDQRRTEYLATGKAIWDMPGNVQEWIDFTLGDAFDPPPACSSGELPTIACAGLVPDDFQSSSGTLDSTNGAGKLIGGSGNALRRGGQVGDRVDGYAGIYALNMNRNTNQTFAGTGFRCVLRL